MLVLCRKEQESIRISDEIMIRVLSIQGNRVRIGIDAPAGIAIVRSKLTNAGSGPVPHARRDSRSIH